MKTSLVILTMADSQQLQGELQSARSWCWTRTPRMGRSEPRCATHLLQTPTVLPLTVRAGFACQGNEFSHYMLLTSFYMLNRCPRRRPPSRCCCRPAR